jgi:hypothetical protein
MSDGPRRSTLTVFCGAGLCNRLMVLASGVIVGETSGRTFTMLWPRTPACGAGFHELFAGSWPVTDVARLEPSLWRLNIRGRHLPVPDLLNDPRPEIVLGHSYWLLRPRAHPDHAPLHARCAGILARLEPLPEIAERVQKFRARHFGATMIGVHLRRGDYHTRHPEMCGNTTAAMAAVDRFLADMPDAGILLATDDGAGDPRAGPTPYEGVRETFGKRYGARIVQTRPRTLDRRTPDAIQDALVDLLLLRSTHAFVGTPVSTFSELAVFGREVPRVLVAEVTP